MMNLPQMWALNSAVECHPHTVEVIGSNPIAPTILCKKASRVFVPHLLQSETTPSVLQHVWYRTVGRFLGRIRYWFVVNRRLEDRIRELCALATVVCHDDE